MAFATGGGGGEFENPPVATGLGVIVRLDDVGSQKSWDGEKVRASAALTIELDPEDFGRKADGSPFTIVKQETAGLYDNSNLTKYLSWSEIPVTKADRENGLNVADLRKCLLDMTVLVETGLTAGGKIKVASLAKPHAKLGLYNAEAHYAEPDGLVKWLRSKAVDADVEPWITSEQEPPLLGTAPAEPEPAAAQADDTQPF